jgi:group I intron endonuclease
MPLAVYWIHHKDHTDMFSQGYIGVSSNVKKRWYDHNHKPSNAHLQNAINKYGWDSLVKEVLLVANKAYCLMVESQLRSTDSTGWNVVKGGGMPPVNKWNKGKKQLPHVTEAVRQYWLGRKQTKEHKAKISQGNMGRKVSPITIEKLKMLNLNCNISCPHCNVVSNKGAMSRWHMDNCKFKENT